MSANEIPDVHDTGDRREYIQIVPSSEEVTDEQTEEQIASLREFKKEVEGGLLKKRFKKPEPLKLEALPYSEGEDEPVEVYYGAEDNLDTLEDRLREIYPPTFSIQRRKIDLRKKLQRPVELQLDEFDTHLQNGNLLFNPDTLAATEVKQSKTTSADGEGEDKDKRKRERTKKDRDFSGVDPKQTQIFEENTKYELPADVDQMAVESRAFQLDPPSKIPQDGTLSTLERPTYTEEGTVYARPSKEAIDFQAVRWFGVSDRKYDWMTTLAPARPAQDEDSSDDEQSEEVTVLSSLFNRLTSMTEPAMVQILFQSKRDWSDRAERRREKIRKGEETVVQKLATDIKAASHSNNSSDEDQPEHPGSFNARTGKPGELSDTQRQKLDRIDKKEPNRTFSVNIRAVSARPLIGAKSRERTARQQYNDIRELSNLLDPINGRFYEIEGIPIKDEGIEDSASINGKIQKKLKSAQVSADDVRDRLIERKLLTEDDKDKFLNRLFQSSKQRPEIVMNPRELASVFILPSGEKMSREAYRMTHSQQKDSQPLTPPKPKLINQYQDGMAIGRPVNQQGDPTDATIQLPEDVLTTHFGRFGASGIGKTVATINDLLTLHENVDGPTILIDPKGGDMCPSYLRAHYAKFRTLDDVHYFKPPETLPAIPFFDIRPLINGNMNREDAVQHKVDHFHEVMAMVMGEDYERAYVGRMIITYLIKGLFDKEHGAKFFPFEALNNAAMELLQSETPLKSSTVEDPHQALDRHTEQSERDFKQTMNSVLNRLDKIRENIYIYYIFELLPRWEDDGYVTPQGPMNDIDLLSPLGENPSEESDSQDEPDEPDSQDQAEESAIGDQTDKADIGDQYDEDHAQHLGINNATPDPTNDEPLTMRGDKTSNKSQSDPSSEEITENDTPQENTDEQPEETESSQPSNDDNTEGSDQSSDDGEEDDFEQTEEGPPVLDFSQYFDKDAVILFDIGDLRGESQRALTMVIVSQLWAQLKAERRRSGEINENDSPQVNLIIEEAKDVIGTDLFKDKIIPEAREFNLSLGLIMQYPEQAKFDRGGDALYSEILNNVQSKMFGKISAQDRVAETITHGLRTETSIRNKLQSLQRGRWIADLPSPKHGMERPSPFSLEALSIPPGHPQHHRKFNEVGKDLFDYLRKESLKQTHTVHSLGAIEEDDSKHENIERIIPDEQIKNDTERAVDAFSGKQNANSDGSDGKDNKEELFGSNINLDGAISQEKAESDEDDDDDKKPGAEKDPEHKTRSNTQNSSQDEPVDDDSSDDSDGEQPNTDTTNSSNDDPENEEADQQETEKGFTALDSTESGESPDNPESQLESPEDEATSQSAGGKLPGMDTETAHHDQNPDQIHQFSGGESESGGSELFNTDSNGGTKGSGSFKDPAERDDVEPTEGILEDDREETDSGSEQDQDVQDADATDNATEDTSPEGDPADEQQDSETPTPQRQDPEPPEEPPEPDGDVFGIPDYGDHIDFTAASVTDDDIARFVEDSPGDSLAETLKHLNLFNKTPRGTHELVRVYMNGHDDVSLDDLDDLPLIDADSIRDELTPDDEENSTDGTDEDVDDQQVSIPGSNNDQIRGATVDDIDLKEYQVTEAQGEFLLSIAKAFMGEKEGYDLIEDSMTDFKSDLSDDEFQELLDRNLVEKAAINRWRYFTLLPEGWKMLPVEKPGLPGEGDWGEKTPHRYGVELLYRYLDQEYDEEWVKRYYMENGVVFDIMAREPTIEGNVILGEVETDSKDKEGVMEDYQKMSDYSHAECIWIFPSKDAMESVASILINETDGEPLSSVERQTATNLQGAIEERDLEGMSRAYTFKGLRDMI